MAKFINVVTGNELETDNSIAIKLMTDSPRYKVGEESEKSNTAKVAVPAEDS